MKTSNSTIEASAPANVRPSSVSKHQVNRGLSTEAVLNSLRTKLPQQYNLAEIVGKWVWLDVSPTRKPALAKMLWTLGFHWNQRRCVWQHPCGTIPDERATYDPRKRYGSYFAADQKPAYSTRPAGLATVQPVLLFGNLQRPQTPPPGAWPLDTFARCAGFNASRPFRQGGKESDRKIFCGHLKSKAESKQSMFTKDLIQAISDWQRGGDANQKKRRGIALKTQASQLPPKFKTVSTNCFRQIALNEKYLRNLGTNYRLTETISSWTLSETVAKGFKNGVPAPGDYTGVIFSIAPPASSVILNIDSLFAEADFVASVAQNKNQVNRFNDGIGRWKNSQAEVVIEITDLPLTALYAYGGYSSSEEKLAAKLFGRTPSPKELEIFKELMQKSGLKSGPHWLSTPDAVARASEKLKFHSARLAKKNPNGS